MSDTVIKFDNVSKSYNIHERGYRSFRNEFTNIVVENQVIVEIKAIENLQTIHEAQILNYLKATGYKIGLLINYTHPKAQIKRLIL